MAAIECRGPDASATAQLGEALFGHTRLAIIGLGLEGKQPVERAAKLLAFNGEIYNYRELAKQLGCDDNSDVNVLFEMCVRGIDSWISKIRGMYAFVYYDAAKQEVLAARDPFGIKPLYYSHQNDRTVMFASTVAALKEILPSRSMDEESLVHFLASGLMARDRTAYKEIRQLPAGQIWRWKKENHGWNLKHQEEIGFGDWPTLPVAEALRDSVTAHLVADVEVGVLLSGGIDSTLLAAMAAKSGHQIKTFSLTNPLNPSIDEGAFARHNAQLIGSIHTEVPVTPEILAQHIRPLIQSIGEPFSDPAYLPLSALAQEVRRHVKVALAGEGADELFGGYRRYDAERWMQGTLFNRFFHPLAKSLNLDKRLASSPANWARYLSASAASTPEARHAALMFSNWDAVIQAFPDFGPLAWNDYQETWRQSPDSEWSMGLPANRAFDLRTWLPEVFLQKSDRASMAHSLEVRTPYLDPVVARMACQLKPANSSKKALRTVLERELPGVQLPKRKRGLDVGLRQLIENHLQQQLDSTFQESKSVLQCLTITGADSLSGSTTASLEFTFRLALADIWYQESF